MRTINDAIALFQAGLDAVRPENLIFDLSDLPINQPVTLLGSGKAACAMARRIAPDLKIVQSFLVSSEISGCDGRLRAFQSTHPDVTSRSLEAGSQMMDMVQRLGEDNFMIYLLSGGTSAMLELLPPQIDLEALHRLNRRLLNSGASIGEINVVRKHLSRIKGGKLGAACKAKGKVFVVSDVIGNDLETIGSAPLYRDRSTREEAIAVLRKYQIFDDLPETILRYLHDSASETPDTANPNLVHEVIASNETALDAICERAAERGYKVAVRESGLTGDVADAAAYILARARAIEREKSVLVFGGETTVTVRGNGKGGRNQELCLHILQQMKASERYTFLSAGTDGIDGVTNAAGACVSWRHKCDAVRKYIRNNDAWRFHRKYGTLIETGATGTNVADVMILIKE